MQHNIYKNHLKYYHVMYFYCLLFLLACIMSKMNMNNEENKSETKKGQHF